MAPRTLSPVPPTASTDPAFSSQGYVPSADRQRVADELLTNMASIRRAGRRHSGRPVELSSLTGAQLELLRLIRRRAGVSIADAAQELRLAPNTVSTLVRQLTNGGLMLRGVHGSDRRVARLELSADIRRKVDAWRDRRVLAVGDAIERLSPEDQRSMIEAVPVLARLAEHLEEQ
jgi:DNA-binding MarR family transcriptional regulator